MGLNPYAAFVGETEQHGVGAEIFGSLPCDGRSVAALASFESSGPLQVCRRPSLTRAHRLPVCNRDYPSKEGVRFRAEIQFRLGELAAARDWICSCYRKMFTDA